VAPGDDKGDDRERHTMTVPLKRVAAAALAAAALMSGTLTGCGRRLEGSGIDADLIREIAPKDLQTTPQDLEALLPLTPGRTYTTRMVRRDGTTRGEVRVVGRRTLAGKSGILVESRRADRVYRLELFDVDPKNGVVLKGIGESPEKMLTFTPPVPVLKPAMREGDGQTWHGIAQMGKSQYMGRAYHRIAPMETVRTPSGAYQAFRLDCLISLTTDQKRVDYPAVLWLAPKVGIVQRRLADKGIPVEEFLAARPR